MFQDTQDLGSLRDLTKGHDLNAHLMTASREMVQENYMSWTGACNACGKMRGAGYRLFFSNYLLGQGGYCPCRNVWCGECYREAESNPFPRLDSSEEANGSDLDLDTPETNWRYCCGQNGDHLMGVPFECDMCSF
jgi:hypothetical protein